MNVKPLPTGVARDRGCRAAPSERQALVTRYRTPAFTCIQFFRTTARFPSAKSPRLLPASRSLARAQCIVLDRDSVNHLRSALFRDQNPPGTTQGLVSTMRPAGKARITIDA